MMFEEGIRGGITQAVKQYAKANNKYMPAGYNSKEISRFLQFKGILEIDVDYPKELHKSHNEMPFFIRKNEDRKGRKAILVSRIDGGGGWVQINSDRIKKYFFE